MRHLDLSALMLRLIALLLPLSFCAAATAADLQLLRITPSGDDAPAGNQIVLSFDRAMVPLGRMEREPAEIPVTVTPEPGCRWRWLDVQTLACALADGASLQAATEYHVDVRAQFTALDGSRLPQAMQHRFSTETPRVQWAEVQRWLGPAQPLLRVRFSQPVSIGSVQRAMTLDGKALVASPEYYDDDTPFYTQEGEAREMWLLTPRRPLTADHDYQLRVQPGLHSAFGPQLGRESRAIEKLRTFAPPRLLGLQCSDGKQSRLIQPNQLCAPLEGLALAFNVPVAAAALQSALRISPAPPAQAVPDETQEDEGEGEAAPARAQEIGGNHEAGQVYAVRAPYRLNAETAYTLALAGSLHDRFGRALGADRELAFRTGARTPRLVFEHTPAVLEAGVDSEVPVIVTNLDSLQAQFRSLNAAGLADGGQHATRVAPVRNLAFAMPLGVREMLGGGSGAVLGTLASVPSTSDKPLPFFAEVTPWQVHAKLGNANLLVWVTGMADGKPVADAEVAVLDRFGGDTRSSARTDGDGLAQLPGSAELDPQLQRQYVSTREDQREPLWLRVQRGKDLALLPLSYEFQVDTWRASREQVSAWRRERHGHLRAWGSTAQGVYRAGDTVQYKLYVRDDSHRSLAPAPAGAYTLRVVDPAGTAVLEQADLRLSSFGALDGSFKLARSAAVGWYRFELQPSYAKDLTLEPMRVLVSDFVPAPFHVSAELRAREAAAGSGLDAQLRATLHGGGAFAGAPARVVARLQAGSFNPDDPLARGYSFDTWQRDSRELSAVLDEQTKLDAHGEWNGHLKLGDSPVLVGSLLLEGSVQDDRGRMIVGTAQIPYYGRDRYIGVHQEGWLQAGAPAQVETLVVDRSGKSLAHVPYYVKIERKITKGARVKSAGNAYITRYFSQWQRIATCHGRSNGEGDVCRFTPDAGGELRAIAMVRDSEDRLHESSNWMYAQGSNAILWEDSPDFSLDVRADRAHYKVGDTARLFVKNPYPGASALITVERYGVLEHRTQKLRGAAPVIELPIKPEYLPGAYVSVVVMSPRVQAPLKEGVDLGKPAFRMGYATLSVDDPYRELQVKVTPEKSELRPRQNASVELQAKPRHASNEPIEFAVAVLDEAVFDLIQGGSGYFDPLKGFTQLDPLDLANYSLLTRLVGRQKFEKKGASPGGDGGADLSLRSVEQFVAYWNPSLKADAQGRARFSFITPDNLSGWRVLAMAVTPSDRMGLGQSKIAVSKPTELRAALPGQLMLGDRFDASFTLMNRAKQTRTLSVKLDASGAADAHSEQSVTLKSFERRTLQMPVSVQRSGVLRLQARAGDGSDQDGLQQDITVRERAANITAADFSLLAADAPISLQLQPPAGATQLGLRVDFAGSLLGNLDGAFRHIADYPYLCWEQRVSKALMAAYYLKLRERLPDSLQWPQASGLPQTLFDDAASFQAPGGGMAFYVAEDRYQSPYLSAYTALAFGSLQSLGYQPPAAVWDKLDAYLHKLLREDIAAPGYDSEDTRAQVRATALAALAQRGKLDAAELRRYQPQLPRMGLFGEAMYAQAAARTANAQPQWDAAFARLLSRGQQSAGSLLLSDERDSDEAWLLGSPLRSNCAALSALAARHAATDAELAAKMARTITQARGRHTYWRNTQEDLYCTRALIDYAQVYEAAPLQLSAQAMLDAQDIGKVQLDATHASASLERPLSGGEQKLGVSAQGSGRAYVGTTLRYANPPPSTPLQAGLAVSRQYYVRRDEAWQALQGPELQVKKGEQLKIELTLDVPAWMTQVVVDDPVPAGLEPINPDLATSSGFDAEELAAAGPSYPYPFYYRELRFEAVRFYAEQIGAGHYRLAYLARAVASGEFAVNEVHAERMYDPDVFADGVAMRLRVEPE